MERKKFLVLFKVKYFQQKKKQAQRKGHPSILTCVAKISDRNQLKVFIPKQMLQRLPIALAQVKTVNTSAKLRKLLCIEQEELLKK